MSEIKGQLLALLVLLVTFGAVASTVYVSTANDADAIEEKADSEEANILGEGAASAGI